ncbi:MAG: flavodoxin family protein [Gemmatimonadaceae bacterium]|nr:flavodoxin family protein [Gemmatimonadaceae bacterium]
MRALILNAAPGPDPQLDELTARVASDFVARRYAVETFALRDVPVAYCQGCFECWTKTPGICKIDDAGRDLSAAFTVCDVVVLVTPVLFGSYSSEAKKVLDRTLGTLLPFFRRIDGEVHHVPRYKYPPALGVIAVLDSPDPDVEQVVRVLALRNAINFGAPLHSVGVVHRSGQSGAGFAACDALVSTLTATAARATIEEIEDVDTLLPVTPLAPDAPRPTRAMLLIGSAKPHGTSTSESLGSVLLERLALHGLDVSMRYVQREAHDAASLHAFASAVRAHDLLIVAAPVYIDALPALVTRALEAILSDRQGDAEPPPLTVAMVLNCGFPESRHASVARTIGALFARRARARWAGALQLGGGGAIHGEKLSAAGRIVHHLPPLLEDAAASLASGRSLTAAVRDGFRQQLMPTTLYMAAGDAGWLWTASHEGALTRLWERPAGAAG